MKKRNLAILSMACSLMIFSVAGCREESVETTTATTEAQIITTAAAEEESATTTTTVAPATEAPATTPAETTEAPTTTENTATTEESTAAVTEETTTEGNVTDNVTISENWADLEFVLAGKKLAMPFGYSELEALGWSFNMADYGYENGYVMNPGDKVYGTIELNNSKYDDKVKVTVGFINNGSEAVDITKCDIWSINISIAEGSKLSGNYPAMEIAKGIAFGAESNYEAIANAFGEAKKTYRADSLGYTVYDYDNDFKQYMKLTVYDEYGLCEIDLKTYE